MRAAIVTSHHNSDSGPKKKKTNSTLIDQGLFWSQIRKYQLTKTYRDLGPKILATQAQQNSKQSQNAAVPPRSSRTSRFRKISTNILGRRGSSKTEGLQRKRSFRDVEHLNLAHPESQPWEFDESKTQSKLDIQRQNDACCLCCASKTPTFDPHDPLKMCWDFFVAALIFYSVLMIPYVIGFNVEPPESMVVFNWIVDSTFAIDMFLNFFTGYHIEGGSLITNKCLIATKYLQGWFVIDLFSTVPIDAVASAAISAQQGNDGASTAGSLDQQLRALKLIRGLRLLRLLKLARLFKLKKLAALLDDSDFFHPAMIKVLSLLFKIVFVAHVLSCFWFLVGSPESNAERPYDGWVFQLGIQDASDSEKYSWSFYWTVATMMAVGYGDVYPRTTQEMMYAIGAQTIGALMFGLIIGTVSTVMETADARGSAIKRKSDEVTEWMRSRKLPKQVRVQIRDHFEYVSHIKSSFRERFILEKLPASLRSEVEQWSYSNIFGKVQFLSKLSDGFLHELLMMMQPVQLMAGESLWRPGNRCRHLYILRQGLIQYEVPRYALNKWKELPMTLKKKEEAEGKKMKEETAKQQNNKNNKNCGDKRVAEKESEEHNRENIKHSKYAIVTPTKENNDNLGDIYVPLAVYTDGGHFGDERVRPMTQDARMLVLNVSDFFVLPLDELHNLYMMFTDDALALRSNAEDRVRNLCKAADALLCGPKSKEKVQEVQDIDNKQQRIEQQGIEKQAIPLLNKLEVDNEKEGAILLDASLRRDRTELKAMEGNNNDVDDEDDEGKKDKLSRSASLQTSSLRVNTKDWMPIVHNGEYFNRGMCSAFWPAVRRVGNLIRFRTVKTNIPEEEWNVVARSSEQRRRNSIHVMTPTTQARFFDDSSHDTSNTSKQHSNLSQKIKPQLDGNGRVYSATMVAEEDQNELWRRRIIFPQRPEKIKWDMFMALLIVYSVAIIPYRICFSMDAEGFWLFVDRTVDVLFAVDMLLTFRTAFFRRHDKIFVTIPSEIAKNYLTSWFTVDFLSTFPVDTVVMEIIMGSSQTSDVDNTANAAAQVRALKLIRVLRLIRLLKLARLLKLGKFIKSVEEALQLSPAAFKLMKLVFNVTFIAHLLACFWYYVSSVESGEVPDNWWNTVEHLADGTVEQHYISSLYWAFTTMTTVGYGDLTPQTQTERSYSIVVMILGATVFGYIVGNVSQMVGQLDVGAARQREQRMMIRNYMKEQDLPREIRMRIDRFFDFYYQRTSIFDESHILRSLPSALRRKVVMHINKKLLKRFWSFFGRVKNELRCALLIALKPSFCLAHDCLYRKGDGATEMYFVQQGKLRIIKGGVGNSASAEHEAEVRRQNRILDETQKDEQNQSQNQKKKLHNVHVPHVDASKNKKEKQKEKEENKTNPKFTYRDISMGNVFGCVEFVLGSARQDTALATQYCTLMVLPRTSVWSIVAGAPDLGSDVQHLLAHQLSTEVPKKRKGEPAAGVFDGIKLKTQNNFLKKFRLKTKKQEHMVEGEMEALEASGGDSMASFVMANLMKK